MISGATQPKFILTRSTIRVAKERRMVEENECNWYFRKRFTFTSVNISYRGAIMNLNICSVFAVRQRLQIKVCMNVIELHRVYGSDFVYHLFQISLCNCGVEIIAMLWLQHDTPGDSGIFIV